ncbi:MAG TPA: CHRD domain-containing protein, partial [Pyrinomonadaceae bacterium]|nr:CHRD domain-containing protein [Pyrinomonadaceae bacterium]
PLGNPINNFVVNPTAQQVIDLRAGQQYMNVHSTGFINGEIRGQLQWNPAEEADFFVRQAYFDFLSRVPDAGGFAFWQNEITQCQSDVQCLRNKRVDVSNAFFYEQEFQQTAAYVLRLYRAAYGNNQPFPNPNANANFPNEEKKLPSYAVFVADRARVIGGANLAQKQLDLANLFVTRAEFTTKYPASLATADQFVDAVLATLQSDLGVNLMSQRTNLINLYNAQSGQSAGRGAVMYRLADDNAANPIANQPFIDAEYNRTFVLGQYFGYLRRNPDIPGFIFWLGQVNGAALRDVPRQHAMVCSFITSAEYQFRFGPVASRNNNECPQ